MSRITKAIWSAAHERGIVLGRLNAMNSGEVRRRLILSDRGIKTVIDVGANQGQYGRLLRRHGFTGQIASFEPLSAACRVLAEQASQQPPWTWERCAMGREPGEMEINVAENSFSSSFLAMDETHHEIDPASRYVGRETVPVRRLDDVAAEAGWDLERSYVKLDVQGFEMEVLRGAPTVLRSVSVVQAEVSLMPLYRGEPTFRDLLNYLGDAGLVLAATDPGYVDRSTGRFGWMDATFVRAD